ncbi:MAG: peptidase C39, partial [Bacteroidales bacterium]
RALYKNPEIIIFDEATSALDSYFEQNIKKLYLNLKKQNKTVIIITHRLNNVLLADQIVLLEKGKLIENGTHHQLMQLKGKYFSLWEHQNVVLDEKEIVSFLE